jgi:hypothetical protein
MAPVEPCTLEIAARNDECVARHVAVRVLTRRCSELPPPCRKAPSWLPLQSHAVFGTSFCFASFELKGGKPARARVAVCLTSPNRVGGGRDGLSSWFLVLLSCSATERFFRSLPICAALPNAPVDLESE